MEVTALIETKTVPIAPESVSFNPPIYVHVVSRKQYKRSLVKNNFNPVCEAYSRAPEPCRVGLRAIGPCKADCPGPRCSESAQTGFKQTLPIRSGSSRAATPRLTFA